MSAGEPPWLAAVAPPARALPEWLARVPPPSTRGGVPLSEAARARLCGAMVGGGEARARFEAWVDPGALEAHAFALATAWLAHGALARDGWALAALDAVSDDALEERLLPQAPPRDAVPRIVEAQRARFERALSSGRDLALAQVRELAARTYLAALVGGIVWAAREPDGALGVSFLVEPGGALVDVARDEVLLAAEARVAIAHPIELGPARLAAWGERLADDEVVQPFAQLARPVCRDRERAGDTIVAPGALHEARALAAALGARGWVRGEPDARVRVRHFHKAFARAGVHAVVTLAPGLGRDGAPQALGDAFFLARRPGGVGFERAPRVPLAEVDAIVWSEVLHDLGALG
ncbi:MAG: DUF4132 domain-containing protein [Sandaracinaceae bacterium]|nr:DUF4132 domain-containing protein [Sandaracinaceae bacterium]